MPRQVEQGRATVRKPCWNRSWPDPLQWLQTSGELPAAAPEPLQVSQVSSRGIWIEVSVPVKDKVKEFSYKVSGGNLGSLFDGTEKALSWDNILWINRTVLLP